MEKYELKKTKLHEEYDMDGELTIPEHHARHHKIESERIHVPEKGKMHPYHIEE